MTPFYIKLNVDKVIDRAMAGDILIGLDIYDANGEVKILYADRKGSMQWIRIFEVQFVGFANPADLYVNPNGINVKETEAVADNFLADEKDGPQAVDATPLVLTPVPSNANDLAWVNESVPKPTKKGK